MSGHVSSGHWTQNRRLQFIEEIQYGVTPASSPAFTSAGEIETISETTEVAMKRYRAVGAEDLYQFLSSGQLYSFEVSYQPISSALIKYGTQAQGGGAGTIVATIDDIQFQSGDTTISDTNMPGKAIDADTGTRFESSSMATRSCVRSYPLARTRNLLRLR